MRKNTIEECVKIFTDGACSGNPGPGAYCAIIKYKNHEKVITGYEKSTTNNRMELMAVISALKSIKRPCRIKVFTDSQYVAKGMTQWIFNWIKNNWKNSKKEDIQNKDLWQELYKLSQKHNIEWFWIEGHNGVPENERCDTIARNIIKQQKSI